MKKSIRILSFLMAFAMLIGSFSVMGSAYEAYKDSAVSYNDVDAPEFTTEQYASMGLDEVDRMLAKEKIELDIYIGKLDLGSVDTAITSVFSLVDSVQNLLPLLGDAASLKDYIVPLTGIQRTTKTDVEVIQALFNFIANIAPLGQKYVNGSISLGIMNSFIADFVFDVRELAIGLIFGLTEEGKAMGELDEDGYPEGYDYMDDLGETLPAKYKTDTAAVTLLQTLINDLILGEWKQLDTYFDDTYSIVNYYSYNFVDAAGNPVEESAPNTAAYDYYGWVHPKDWVTVGLGGAKRVANGAAAPDADYSLIDINAGKMGYDFIEDLLQAAFNYILIPVLNRDTVRWVREQCGITYLDKYTRRTVWDEASGEWINNPDYDPNYAGEAWTAEDLTAIAPLFKLETAIKLDTFDIPEDTTLVDYFNTLLGDFLADIANESAVVNGVTYSWTWDYGTDRDKGDNSKLFANIAEVGRFVLQVTGDEFFGSTAFKGTFPTAEAIGQMNDQQVVSLVLRGILNSSVDYVYVDDSYQTLVDVAYRATEQLAWQDIPQFTYTKPVRDSYTTDLDYYYAVLDKMITILFDIAVYNLNQNLDMVPADGDDPVAGEGLLQYQGDDGHYTNLLIQIVAWAFSDYAPLLALDLQCYNAEGSAEDLTEDMVWQDLDTIVNALIPIKGGEGNEPWIAAEIAGDGQTIVSKAFIFDYILKPIYSLDATNLATIFKRNTDGAFAKNDGVAIIVNILENVFNLLFPGVFQSKATIDEILNNELLGAMVADLLKSLGTNSFIGDTGAEIEGRANDIILVGLPLICMLLGLSDDQEFEEMEIYLPGTISTSGELPTFEVINGSSGINTFHTAANGSTTQDKLYEYEIATCVVNTYNASGALTQTIDQRGLTGGTKIPGGGSVDVTLTGTRNEGDVVEFQVNYYILGEDGQEMTEKLLSKTVYAYVGDNDEDDDNITISTDIGSTGRKYEYADTIYLSSGDSLTDIENYNIRIKDNNGGSAANAAVTSVTQNAVAGNPLNDANSFIGMNDGSDDSKPISQSMTGQEGLYFFSPFKVKENADGEIYKRFEIEYQVDEDGNLVLDENDEPIPAGDNGGVPDGQYSAATVLNVGGSNVTVNTTIHLYKDFGLEGLFNRTVSANRQYSNYDQLSGDGAAAGLWNNYKAALMDAARLVLMPKEGSEFAAKIATNAVNPETNEAFVNKYEELAYALDLAIEALDEYALDEGVENLKDAIDAVSGINYTVTSENAVNADGESYTILTKEDIEYWEDEYTHFGMRDYVPHTYNRYKDARRLAESIINSQEFFPSMEDPREIEYHVATPEEIQEYTEYMEEYATRRIEMGAVNAIDSIYAIHMIELTSGRLIRLPGNISKLQEVYAEYSTVDTSVGTYIGETKQDYDNAVAFAAKVIAKGANARPSEINIATSKLIETWKDLSLAGDYSLVDAALLAAATEINNNGMDPDAETIAYTAESYRAFLVAYNDALRAQTEKPYAADDNDQARIDAIALALTTAQAALEARGSGAQASVEFKSADELAGRYPDANYSYFFTPRLTEGAYTPAYWGSSLEDGTTIDGFVVGYGINCLYGDADVLDAFNMTGYTAEVTAPAEGSMYSTGTVIKFVNDSTGAVDKVYVVVVIGDVNNDNVQDTLDVLAIEDNAAYITDWEWGYPSAHWNMVAADVDNNGQVDTADGLLIDDAANYMGRITQEVGAPGESSFIAE